MDKNNFQCRTTSHNKNYTENIDECKIFPPPSPRIHNHGKLISEF